jgi:hypothetical protein
LHIFTTVYAYFDAGYLPVCLVSRDNAARCDGNAGCPTSAQIKALLPGTLAVLGYNDLQTGPHAVVWDGTQLMFCDYTQPDPVPKLSDLELTGAMLLFPRPSSTE